MPDDKPKLRMIQGGGQQPPTDYERDINVAFAQLAIAVCTALMGKPSNDPNRDLPHYCLDFVHACEAYRDGTGDHVGYPLSTIDLNERGKAMLIEVIRLLRTHPDLQP